jgi:hypothetical protein
MAIIGVSILDQPKQVAVSTPDQPKQIDDALAKKAGAIDDWVDVPPAKGKASTFKPPPVESDKGPAATVKLPPDAVDVPNPAVVKRNRTSLTKWPNNKTGKSGKRRR